MTIDMTIGTVLTVLALTLTAHPSEADMKKTVAIDHAGATLAGVLYLPDDYREGARLPAIVVTGAWTTVKEQMPSTYAAEMANRGFAALVFDFRGWGQSPDRVPYLEDPARKTADIEAALDFLASRPEVDPTRIGGFGICASAGYMSDAAANSDKVRSVALVAPWLHDREIVDDTYGGTDSVDSLIETGRQASAAETPVLIEAASLSNENALMYQAPYYTEEDRGLIPEYDNRFNVASWEGWLTYDALKTANDMQKPVLLVHSEAAAIPQGAKAYAERMGGNAETLWLDDVTQFDFYDDPDAVETAANAAAAHFARTLN